VYSSYYNYFLFYFNTGARTGEIYSVRKCDINFGFKTVFINGTKTKSSARTIPLMPALFELQNEFQDKVCNDKLFVNSAKVIAREFYKILDKIGVDKNEYSPYSMRHSFATRCYERGIDPKMVSKWMGHTNLAMTNHYTHIMNDHE